ncbi:hypothetical protein FSP39_017226, partial [Pinctada imbricata]
SVYKSPEYETLGFDLLKNKMVDIGYPAAIKDFVYDPNFPIRGVWFDSHYGNILKVDAFGNILVCVHGFQFMRANEMHSFYPNKFVQKDASRFRIFNTLYDLPVIYLLACIVDFFSNHPDYTRTDRGVKSGDILMTYQSIFQDVQTACEYVHDKDGPLKSETVKDLEKYVIKEEKLGLLLDRMRSHGGKVFLATNSGYRYTNREWTSYFDYIIVDSRKPLFFGEGTILRQVDRETGSLHIGSHTGPIQTGKIYSGGSVDVFAEMTGSFKKEVLYFGDHIFGDILKSKKGHGWKTFLVVPEMSQELMVWTKKKDLFEKLEDLEAEIGEMYRNLDSSSESKPDISHIQNAMKSSFASQVMRYADLYAASVMNLLHYPLSYAFRAPSMLMPHESTVDHMADLPLEVAPMLREVDGSTEDRRKNRMARSDSIVPNLYAPVPRQFTQVQEEDENSTESEPESQN